jgi:hypothetical protein
MTMPEQGADAPKPKSSNKVAGCFIVGFVVLVIVWIIGYFTMGDRGLSVRSHDRPSGSDSGLRRSLENSGASEDTIRKNEQFRDNVQKEMDRMRRERK